MGLQSKLFRSDARLEACLTSDPDHVTKGGVGDHVAKIQSALAQIDNLNIQADELVARIYGASTAAAVLSFKRRRNIINVSYQTHADDIVGKMTIAALDREMVIRENRRIPSINCGDPVGGGGFPVARAPVAAVRSAFAASAVAAGPFRKSAQVDAAPAVVPANLDILWQVTSAAAARGAQKHLGLLSKAIGLLKPVGMDIVSSVASPPDAPFPNNDFVDARFRDDAFKVRKAAEKARPGAPNVLRIIVCPFEPSSPEFGITEGGTLDNATFPAFVLINVNKFRADQCTALHEMIHATGLFVHDDDATLGDSVFSTGSTRSVLRPEHAQRLSRAFFAKRK